MKKLLFIIAILSVGYLFGQEDYRIKNLDVNTKYSDFGTTLFNGEAVFASARPSENKSTGNWTNGQPYLELFKGGVDGNGEIIDPKPFSNNLNTKYHESNLIFTKDGKTVYFTRNNYFQKRYGKDSLGWNNLKLFRADVDDTGHYTNVTELPFNDDNYSVGHPALSPDERTLYFTSDMPGSMGGTDIFKASVSPDGTYGSPINLGAQVNTSGNEMFPFITESGKMYYSSNGKGGFGGLDVYVTPISNLNSAPVRLSAPINSSQDDFCFVINEDTKKGYFSSNRLGGKGDDDIYYFDELKSPDMSKVVLGCSQNISGKVRDKVNGALLPGSLVSLYKGTQKVESVIVGSDAAFSFPKMECNTAYRVVASKDLYNGDEKSVSTTGQADLNLSLDLSLAPDQQAVEKNKQIDNCQYSLDDINTIYFDLDKYYIRSDAAAELDKIVLTMKKCPNIVIEARSHTDSRASNSYNETLSQNRAQATVDYIVSHGILANRISAKGYGETRLVNKCADGVSCTEEEHQQNRRTEFVIVRD